MVTVRFGKDYEEKKRRMKYMKDLLYDYAMAKLKMHALEMVRNFKEGITKNNFRLEPLKIETIERKRKEGLPHPRSPLYGYGETADKSYMNMLRLRRMKNGWSVYPSWGKHHKADLPLRILLMIHEYGKSFVNQGGTITRIPPRPAFRKAYERTLKKMKVSKDLQKVMNEYIKTGKSEYLKKMKQIADKDEKRIIGKIQEG